MTLTSHASRLPSPAHLPPQTCASSTTTRPFPHLFLIIIYYLTYLTSPNLPHPLIVPSLYASLISQDTGIPLAGHGPGRSTGRHPSSNAPPHKPSTIHHPPPPRCACSRSGTKTTCLGNRTHLTSPSPNRPTPITSTPSSKE
jgi:hypothetical protein